MARWYELKGWNPFVMIVLFILMCCICAYNFCILYLLSSPYLLVFGDDRVRGTHEQIILMQVVLVRLSHGTGIAWGAFYIFYVFGNKL